MKTFLLSLIFLISASLAHADNLTIQGGNLTVSGGNLSIGAPVGDPNMLLYWSTTTTSFDKSGGAASPTITGTGSGLSSAQVKDGVTSFLTASVSGASGASWTLASTATVTNGTVGMYVYLPTLVANNMIFELKYGSSDLISVYDINSTGTLQAYYKGSGAGTNIGINAGGFTAGTWHFLALAYSSTGALPSGHTFELQLDGSTIASSSATLPTFANIPNKFVLGNSQNDAGNPCAIYFNQVLSSQSATETLYPLRDNTSF